MEKSKRLESLAKGWAKKENLWVLLYSQIATEYILGFTLKKDKNECFDYAFSIQ